MMYGKLKHRKHDELKRECNSLSILETIVADFGDNLSPKTATVAVFGDSLRNRRL